MGVIEITRGENIKQGNPIREVFQFTGITQIGLDWSHVYRINLSLKAVCHQGSTGYPGRITLTFTNLEHICLQTWVNHRPDEEYNKWNYSTCRESKALKSH